MQTKALSWKMWLGTALVLLLTMTNAVGAQELSFYFENASYRDIFTTIGEFAGLSVLIDDGVSGSGTVEIKNRSLEEALDLVAELSGCTYSITDSSLLVGLKSTVEQYEKRSIRLVTVKHVEPQTLVEMLSRIFADIETYVQENGIIVLNGTVSVLDEAEILINDLDRPRRTYSETEQTVLDVLRQLAFNLDLNLIALSEFDEKIVITDLGSMDPDTVIEQLKKVVDIEIEFKDDSMIAARKEPEVVVDPDKIKVYRLNHTEPQAAARMIGLILPSDRIQIDESTKSVMIRAKDYEIAQVDQFILEYDQPLTQVLLEVWIQEMSSDALNVFGIEWNPNFEGFVLSENRDSGSKSYVELTWEPWEVAFALRALEDSGQVKILASPKIATLSGQEANIFVGDRVPIVLRDDEDNERIEFLESGINLRVLPRVSDDGYITIAV
ncbi:MAG: hypothetical protein GX177_09840, partial [Firmicutes bacterium]|nr:hypothetical protein [Bacillota bacterium]